MKPVTINQNSQAIVYDADALPAPDAGMFSPEFWAARNELTGSAPGRGTAWFINSPAGDWVLRRYLRGGMVAKLSEDSYLFTGFENSRPLQEFALLREMHEAGLRVPVPVAALCQKEGLTYRGALITELIEDTTALAELLGNEEMDWQQLGGELRALHEAGMNHADLNARNILHQAGTNQFWVLDLDRSSFTPGKPVDGGPNLARLKRSLEKLWPENQTDLDACWSGLMEGYRD